VTQPFQGIKVLDLTHVLAGPFAAYQLALLGADVLKVEHPSDPDQVRIQGTDAGLNRQCMGTMFLAQSANKRSLTLDLKHEAARDLLKKLVLDADVFIENYRPGAFDALGLGYEALAALNPRLIYCSVSAYGQSGPRGWHTGYDNILQASSGLMDMTGTPESGALKIGAPAVDYATGAMTAFALSSALFQRERTGKGQRIDMSMLDASLILLSSHITAYSIAGTEPQRIGNDYPFATLGCYRGSEGEFMLGAANLRQQRRLWLALGLPEMIKENNEQRAADRLRERSTLEKIFLNRSAQDWEDWLEAHHIPAARVRSMAEALVDPQLNSRSVLAQIDGLDEVGKGFQVPMTAFSFAHGGPSITRLPPRMGEHNYEVLTALGYDAADIAQLKTSGVI
jgi:crotonobetainyl-CoA:carnitine CoA-transferase CaiB-like acyl-CoA transferase